MGISPKTETRCRNFSFFGRQDLQKRDFRKTRNCGSVFQFLGKCPYPIGAPRALRYQGCNKSSPAARIPFHFQGGGAGGAAQQGKRRRAPHSPSPGSPRYGLERE